MSAGNRPLVTAADNKIAPQYYNPTSDQYEHVQGKNGGNNVNVIESSLPAGAATAAKQDQQTAQLEALNAQVATDGKLDLILSKLTDLETEIEAIKSTDGIKRIDETVPVQLTGSNVKVAKGQYDQTVTVAPGGSTRISVIPPPGELWRIKGLYINVPAVAGASGGIHQLILTRSPSLISEYALLNARSLASDQIRLSYNQVTIATDTNSQPIPSSSEAQQRAIQSLVLTNEEPLVIYYTVSSSAEASQTGSISIAVVREVESIV